MNFEFSEEQQELRAHARKLLHKRCPLTEVHRLLNCEDPYSSPTWASLVDAGWTATALPEEFGGHGMGYLELCVLAEELGRAVAPVPFSSAVYLAAEALKLVGTDKQRARYLPALANGTAFGTLALIENSGPLSAASINCAVKNGRITGRKLAVPDAEAASYGIIAARDPGGVSLLLVDFDGEGVKRERACSIDPTRSYSEVHFNQAPAEPLGVPGQGLTTIGQVYDHAAVLLAFEQLGGAEAALAMACQYAKDRYTFGRPIGSYQAIKHRLARMFVEVELARSNCYHGAYALATGAKDLPLAAAAARLSAGRAFTVCAQGNTMIHGGMGFTWEGDCQLYFRRARLLGLALGSERSWKDKLINRVREEQQPGRLGRKQNRESAEAAHGF